VEGTPDQSPGQDCGGRGDTQRARRNTIFRNCFSASTAFLSYHFLTNVIFQFSCRMLICASTKTSIMSSKKIIAALLSFSIIHAVQSQETSAKSAFALEARVTTYIQSGFDLGAYFYPKNSKFSFGALIAGHEISGNTKELLFESSNHDNLDKIRLNWIVSANARYHLAAHREGFFAEVGIGLEEFEVKRGIESSASTNGFIAPSVGYIWHPWGRSGFYLMPKVNAPIILSRPDEHRFSDGTDFRLKSLFVTPAIAIGWKFGG
jgi:hypothetical protein